MVDLDFMQFALSIAEKAKGRTSPNPMVGAVVVKQGRIVGMGAHLQAGKPHAEVYALQMAGDSALGATLYVTLEPCNHFGKTPPCADLVIRSGIRKVVIAMQDPNPLVAGQGVRKLQEAGIEVQIGLCEDQAQKLNEVFVKTITTDLPFIAVKTATTLDGKIATHAGDSKWITGLAARTYVHQLRDQYDAIMVGVGTVLADNPKLTAYLIESGHHPHRLIVDPSLKCAHTSRGNLHILDVGLSPTTFLCSINESTSQSADHLRSLGCEVLGVPELQEQTNVLDLQAGFRMIKHHLHLMSVLVEGGATLNGHLLDQSLIDKVYLFYAQKLIGGKHAPTNFAGNGISNMQDAWQLTDVQIRTFDQDLCIIGYPKLSFE